ncbi:MAG: DEAD/DEAH box helicase [Limnochordaceae bacterium]|nr:DEAD/DEAH box helicase [Limnochordaceae bacterium]
MAGEVWQGFHPYVRRWFTQRYGEPTPPQQLGWPAIQQGENVLLMAPTGSGKTFAAFLVFLDRLLRERLTAGAGQRLLPQGFPGVRVLYVSPLRALDNDIHRNLAEPLAALNAYLLQTRPNAPPLRAEVRTSDTPPAVRERIRRSPPDILITTPESLFLMLLSPRLREVLRTVEAVVIDELHALAPNKRGSQLVLSLEWLEWYVAAANGSSLGWAGATAGSGSGLGKVTPVNGEPRSAANIDESRPRLSGKARQLQRIGLSATQRPLAPLARWLGGCGRPVRVIDAGLRKELQLQVDVATPDMVHLPEKSIWPAMYRRLTDEVLAQERQHRTTLIFVNNRAVAERIAAHMNELAGHMIARSHHGSLSRSTREEVEEALKNGTLPAVVATGSLELGIDVGHVNLVIQVESPKSVTRGLQRVGRAGHLFRATSRGLILPKTREDLLETAAIAAQMVQANIEPVRIPQAPLDVLVQQVAAMVAMDDWREEELLACVRQAAPYRHLSGEQWQSVLHLLSGGYRHPLLTRLRPRLVWDREKGWLRALPGTRLAVLQGAGTIADRGLYPVLTVKDRQKVGELDEEFVFESRVGDVVALGTSAWRIEEIRPDRVLVSAVSNNVGAGQPRGNVPSDGEANGSGGSGADRQGEGHRHMPSPERRGGNMNLVSGTGRRARLTPDSPLVRLPFWRGEGLGRPAYLGVQIGKYLEDWEKQYRAAQGKQCVDAGSDRTFQLSCLAPEAAATLDTYLRQQYQLTGVLPTARRLIVETFPDSNGQPLTVIHSIWGNRVNQALRLALLDLCQERWHVTPSVVSTDQGLLVRPPADDVTAAEWVNLLHALALDWQQLERRVLRQLQDSPLLGAAFRAAARRCLLLAVPRRPGQRQPLWLQRLQAQDLWEATRHYTDFPVWREAVREVLEDWLDLPTLQRLMEGVGTGQVQVVATPLQHPSPFCASLLFTYSGAFIYDDDSPRSVSGRPAGELQPARPVPAGVNWALATTALAGGDLRSILDSQVLVELRQQLRAVTTVVTADQEGIPTTRTARDQLRQWALLHGPFTWAELAAGAGQKLVTPGQSPAMASQNSARMNRDLETGWRQALADLEAAGELVSGRFRRDLKDGAEQEWCAVDFLRVWARRSLGRTRRQVQAHSLQELLAWLLGRAGGKSGESPVERVADVVNRLQFMATDWPSWLELLARRCGILTSSVPVAKPDLELVRGSLDELCRSGQLVWQCRGRLVWLWTNLNAAVLLEGQGLPQVAEVEGDELVGAVLRELSGRPRFWAELERRMTTQPAAGSPVTRRPEIEYLEMGRLGAAKAVPSAGEIAAALARLVLAGRVTADTVQPVELLQRLPTPAMPLGSGEQPLSGQCPQQWSSRREQGWGLANPMLRVWGRPGQGPAARRRYLDLRRRLRTRQPARISPAAAGVSGIPTGESGPFPAGHKDGLVWQPGRSPAFAGRETVWQRGRWQALPDMDQAIHTLLNVGVAVEQVRRLYGVVCPATWGAWWRVVEAGWEQAKPASARVSSTGQRDVPSPGAAEAQGPQWIAPEIGSWREAEDWLTRAEWRGEWLRGDFVMGLDGPQFMQLTDWQDWEDCQGRQGWEDPGARQDGQDWLGRKGWLVRADEPFNPWGLWQEWPDWAAAKHVHRDDRTWLWVDPGGQLAWIMLASREHLLVDPAVWGSSEPTQLLRPLAMVLEADSECRRTGRLDLERWQEQSVIGSQAEEPLREVGFRSTVRGLALYADERDG